MSDVIEVKFEDLGLTKPLEKMTQKELREMCMEKLPQITGASGKSKEELVAIIKELFGIEDTEPTPAELNKENILKLKAQMRDLKGKRAELGNRKQREIMRRKISKLKKETRRLAKNV
ncbi:hypothetical protein dsx2_3308 [Desulfovibrio sp. X2]|uniref:hypothetical protein n=1 Tax=Desulfovibrio sp. X2 TaxID=941449 RepID=UPI000358841C|nr:hypothetical protein [Desulfovibrio sp. X2]EPR40868.1 hypothetical protein dsx2_3308 [Desulfovibrio sp. X2]